MAYRGRNNHNWKFPDYYKQPQLVSPETHNAVEAWLAQLKKIWSLWKKSEGVTKMLHEYFASSPNPYESALFIMSKCDDFYQAKPNSLTFTVMEEFSRWVADKRTMLSHTLTHDVKCDAFNLALEQRNNTLMKLIFNVYQLSDVKELFVEPIKELASRKQYKDACQCATLLQLHENFSCEDFIIPLVFQDKLSVAEEFLISSPTHQRQLVSFIDNILGSRNTRVEADAIIRRLDIPEVKRDKLYYKPMSKLVARLTKIYNLPPETCPNLNQKRNEGALQFLVHKRYVENTLGMYNTKREIWREMVREAVGDNKELQVELLVLVNSSGDPQEALYWANIYGIPKQRRPYNVQILQEEGHLDFGYEEGATALADDNDDEYTSEVWDDDVSHVQYHRFPLSHSSILLVDTRKKFEEFLSYIKGVPMVGIDAEWKPHFWHKKK
ncbi:hypothetical protein L9F63_011810 [Diploptera punctata]|uniref:Uncharacterized protein n=1 Tax=Diploptera punctata TaxID=6984 RepID=A0AAD8ADY7_DIPPU|nr:hypothetical protein L9F63_011810 [Diploptera punctata]